MVALAACSQGATGGSNKPYYAGKTIEIVVPQAAGGGLDALARFLTEIITKNVDGHPKVAVLNQEAGRGLPALNRFASKDTKPDNFTLAAIGTAQIGSWLFGEDGVDFSLPDFAPLAGVGTAYVTYVSKNLGVSDVAGLKALGRKVPYGNGSPTGGVAVLSLVGLHLLGASDSLKVILGYGGGGEIQVAFERHEVDMATSATTTYITNFRKSGTAVPLFHTGFVGKDGEVGPDPTMPEVPSIAQAYEKVYGHPPSGQEWDYYKAVVSAVPNNVLLMRADAPAEAREALIAGVRKGLADPAFEAKRKELWGEYPMLVGPDWAPVQETWKKAAASDEVGKWVQQFMTEKYGADFK